MPALVLESNDSPASLRGRLRRHRLAIDHESRISALVSRRRVDVRQETSLQVRYGAVSSLVVQVPFPETDAWEVQARETVRREDLGQSGGGTARRRYRLTFDPPISDRTSLQFKFELPLGQAAGDAAEVRSTIPWILLEEGSSRSTSVELRSEPGIKTSVSDTAWVEVDEAQQGRPTDEPRKRYRMIASGQQVRGFPFSARPLDQVAVPPLVASRVLLRTTLGSDEESRTHAWYLIETHASHVSFSLPEHASWVRARIDGRSAEQIELDPALAGYRLGLPSDSRAGPVLVEIEYQLSKASPHHGCLPPRLLEGAVALETLWEVQIPWNVAVIGVPEGWSDENQWYWDSYVWKRRPWKSFARLVGWVAGSTSQTPGLEGVSDDEREDAHGYLFGRSGQPVPLRPWVASRAWIVGLCSGTMLALGFLFMFSGIRFRVIWVAVAILCLLGAVVVHPSTVLLIVQSSFSGLVLASLGLAIQRLIDRSRSGGPAAGAGSTSSSSGVVVTPPGSAGVGSDDSTAIRVRVPSTMDHVAAPLVVRPEQPSARSSSFEPSG